MKPGSPQSAPVHVRKFRRSPSCILKAALALFLVLIASLPISAEEMPLDMIIQNIRSNHVKLVDFYADTTTTITSSMRFSSGGGEGPRKMIQKGRIWTKGSEMSKTENLSPARQITIVNRGRMAVINPETGEKTIREIEGGGQGREGMDLEKAKGYFDMSVRHLEESGQYVITGVPKGGNRLFGKIEFYVDGERWVPVRLIMYGPNDRPMSETSMEYEEIQGAWVQTKSISSVTTPIGRMEIETENRNIKVNEGIGDNEFKI